MISFCTIHEVEKGKLDMDKRKIFVFLVVILVVMSVYAMVTTM